MIVNGCTKAQSTVGSTILQAGDPNSIRKLAEHKPACLPKTRVFPDSCHTFFECEVSFSIRIILCDIASRTVQRFYPLFRALTSFSNEL